LSSLNSKTSFNKINDSLKKNEVYTLEINNNPEGFFICELKKEKKQVYLDELGISERNQGKGYGKSIIKFIEDEDCKRGFKEITLVADKNAKAPGFYNKMGYRLKNEWLLMTKNLI
jgi:GNAT superfamily N-acetyltransferase